MYAHAVIYSSCTRKVCLRLLEPPHTTGQQYIPPEASNSAMFLIYTFEFLRFKKPKTKRCKTLILNMSPTPSRPKGQYGASAAITQRNQP